MSMIEAKLHLFQVQEKMVSPDAIVPPELGLREAPEVLNAVDVVAFPARELPPMVDPHG